MSKLHVLFFLSLQVPAECYHVNLTGPKFARRNEPIHALCWSNQTPIGLTADFLVNDVTYSSLRSTEQGCYSAHLRTRCPPNSSVCYCDKDGKEYGLQINLPFKTNTMTVVCLMKFQHGGQTSQSNNLIIKIYDPPSLSINKITQCNMSSSVEMVCVSFDGSVIYDDWYHSYNGKFIKKMKGEHIGNRSTITIGSCSIEDLGDYMCKAGYLMENETFWANVTTNLEIHGPPKVFGIRTTTKPTEFSIVFYSSAQPITIKWFKDDRILGNSTDFEFMTRRHNISVDSDGVPMVLHGYTTSLVISKRLSGVYSVLLRNDLGEYHHKFSIPTEKNGFSLQICLWILICVAVFLINSTIATLTRRRRRRRFLKRSGIIGTVGIYYAAPSTSESTSQYNSTTQQNNIDATDNAASSLYAEIIDEQVQQEDTDEMSPHYIELE